MKKFLYTFSVLFIGQLLSAQVIIGGSAGTASDKTSVLLEFEGQNKGIVLPYTRSLPSSPAEGTLLLEAGTSTQARVKYYNGSWIDLSGQDADITPFLAIQPTSSQVTEDDNQKVVIGSSTSSADGVLVLESSDKAMLLPITESTDNIAAPSPGMIVFINKSEAKRLAVFNGSKWSYWMP